MIRNDEVVAFSCKPLKTSFWLFFLYTIKLQTPLPFFHWGAVFFSDPIELLAFHLKLFRISWWSHYFAANWPDQLDGAEPASRRVSHHRLLHGSVRFSEVISDWRNVIVTCTRYWECWNITRLLACSNLLPGSGLSQTNSSGGTLLYSKKAACSVACVLSNVAWFSFN